MLSHSPLSPLISRLTRGNPTNPFSRCRPLILQISTPLCDSEAIMHEDFYLCVWDPLFYLEFSRALHISSLTSRVMRKQTTHLFPSLIDSSITLQNHAGLTDLCRIN